MLKRKFGLFSYLLLVFVGVFVLFGISSYVYATESGGSNTQITLPPSISAGPYIVNITVTGVDANGIQQVVNLQANITVPAVAPTASLTVNGAHAFTLNVGQTANYVWSSSGGSTYGSTYSIVPADGVPPCNWPNTGSWDANNSGGASSGPMEACTAGHTFTFVYKVTGASGQIATDSITVTIPLPEACTPVQGTTSGWSSCTAACGGGTCTQTRTCSGNSCGGNCNGQSLTQTYTNTTACPAGMSGTLSATNCTIASGASSCNTTLNWGITNPEAIPTAITASGMTNINVTNTLATPQSGTQSASVPYPSRTFYLYNNAKSLVPVSPNGVGIVVTASCIGGTSWVGGVCASSVNTAPVPTNATISPKPINPNGTSTYTITTVGTDANGGADIDSQYALINFQVNVGADRGYVGWSSTQGVVNRSFRNATPIGTLFSCTGGGFGSELSGHGDAYINLISCSTSVSGNTRTSTFVVSFNPAFTTPTTNNTISSWVSDVAGLYEDHSPPDYYGWKPFGTFNLTASSCPTLPPTSTLVTCNSPTQATVSWVLPAPLTQANVRVNLNSTTCVWPPNIIQTISGNSYGPFTVTAGQPNCYWIESNNPSCNPTNSNSEGSHTFTCGGAPDACGTANGVPQLSSDPSGTAACTVGVYANSPADTLTAGSQAWNWSCGTVTTCSAPKYGCRITTDSNYDLPAYGANGPNNNFACSGVCENGASNYPTCTLATITFNGNGNTGGSTASQTITTNTSVNLTTNGFTRTGYSFTGWNTLANGAGTSYANGASYTIGTTNVILYAKWTAGDACGNFSGATPRLTEPTTNPDACNPGVYANSPADTLTAGSQAWNWSCGTVTTCSAPKYGCRITTDSNYDLPAYGANGPNNNFACSSVCENGATSGYPACTLSGGGGGASCDEADWYNIGGTWTNRKVIVIDHTKVQGTQAGFPVLISLSGGDYPSGAQPSGNDILFTSSDGKTKLAHEIEKIGSGQLVAWVKMNVSSSADTKIYMYYGNGSASNQQNVTGVWDSNYKGVYHFKDGTSALSLTDSTNNGWAVTKEGSPTYATGKIDGGMSLPGTNSNDITISDPNSYTNFTVSIWAKPVDKSYYRAMITAGGGVGFILAYGGDSYLYNQYTAISSTLNTWERFDVTFSSGSFVTYYNGTYLITQTIGSPITPVIWSIGHRESGNVFNGVLDEFRLSNIARSADWIKTEYNNQSSPSAFYGISSQCVPSAAASINIDAVPLTLTYGNSGSGSQITWSSSGVTPGSCTVTHQAFTDWISDSGSQPSGPLTYPGRTYTLTCQPGSISKSVGISVQAASLDLCITKSGQGTVTPNPVGGVAQTCQATGWSYTQNTSVVITATKALGRIFTGWGGACLGTLRTNDSNGDGKPDCTVVMDSAKAVIVNFAVDPNYKEF